MIEKPRQGVIERPKLRTRVSEVWWCAPRAGYSFQTAQIQSANSASPVSWLDRLLEGGIVLPEQDTDHPEGRARRALTLLLTGPPGTGKTTLASELCMRWAQHEGYRSIFVTTESFEPWLLENARSFRWPPALFRRADSFCEGKAEPAVYVTRVSPRDLNDGEVRDVAHGRATGLFDALKRFFDPPSGVEALFEQDPPVEVLVLDSLNTIPFEESKHFRFFTDLLESGPRILIMVMDYSRNYAIKPFWEYMSDIVLHLDTINQGYLVRTIEVVKARYQAHVWGRHQLKIYEGPKSDDARYATTDADVRLMRMRAHPFVQEGGVFIFPSIHAHLSHYKRQMPHQQLEYVDSRLEGLRRMLGRGNEGYPEGRCTALLGERGGHKSRLGYFELLSNMIEAPQERTALVVSLRDDEGVVQRDLEEELAHVLQRMERSSLESTLIWLRDELVDVGKRRTPPYESRHLSIVSGILDRVRQDNGDLALLQARREILGALQEVDRFEIMYCPPGYITPDEFFHRILISISRLKRDGCRLMLLFNSLDQLSSRFPLCAREEMFVPGLVAMLSAESVTSFFVSASEVGGQDARTSGPRHYGLDAVAELILSYRRCDVSLKGFLGRVADFVGTESRTPIDAIRSQLEGEVHQSVEVRVERFAGGTSAGLSGFLELVGPGHILAPFTSAELAGSPPLFSPGLHFFPDFGGSQ